MAILRTVKIVHIPSFWVLNGMVCGEAIWERTWNTLRMRIKQLIYLSYRPANLHLDFKSEEHVIDSIWKQGLQNHINGPNFVKYGWFSNGNIIGLKMHFLRKLKTVWWRIISILRNHMVKNVPVKRNIGNDLKNSLFQCLE